MGIQIGSPRGSFLRSEGNDVTTHRVGSDPERPGLGGPSPMTELPALPRSDSEAGAGAPPASGRMLSSEDLLGPGGVLHIRHGGALYVLRQTRNGRLILTK